jgi:hypothetical protein
MNPSLCSISRFVAPGLLAFGLIVVTSTPARADSIAYNVLGTFSNGQQLSGQITWNTVSHSVISSNLFLSGSTFSATCSSGCGAVFAGFWGAGTLSKSYEILVGAFLPNSSAFALTVTGRQGTQIFSTHASWAKVAVPEEPILSELLIVLMGLGWLASTGGLSQLRKPLA